jgi:copper chaperone CopZ
MKKFLLLLMVALTVMAASAKDIKTVVFTTEPPMHCEGCENRIKNNLRFEKGIKKIVTDVEKQTVTITYDADKTTVENLIKGFEKIDYVATEIKDGEQPESTECTKGECPSETQAATPTP